MKIRKSILAILIFMTMVFDGQMSAHQQKDRPPPKPEGGKKVVTQPKKNDKSREKQRESKASEKRDSRKEKP